MRKEDTNSINIGDEVTYQGRRYRIASGKYGLIGGPHYRLSSVSPDQYPGEDLTSYQLIGLVHSTAEMDRKNLEADVIATIRDLNDGNLEIVLELASKLLNAQNGPDPNDTDDYLADR